MKSGRALGWVVVGSLVGSFFCFVICQQEGGRCYKREWFSVVDGVTGDEYRLGCEEFCVCGGEGRGEGENSLVDHSRLHRLRRTTLPMKMIGRVVWAVPLKYFMVKRGKRRWSTRCHQTVTLMDNRKDERLESCSAGIEPRKRKCEVVV